jgi:drug/metabolite transporter (DMT)-like permease
MGRQKKAYLYAMTAVLLWATVATAFKVSLRYVDPLQLLFLASTVSVAVLFGVLAARGKLGLLRQYSRREYLHSALLGLLNPFLYYVILFKAYDLLPAQHAQPINMTWPIVLVLLSIPILKQKTGFLSMLAILVSFFGVYILSTRGDIFGFRFESPPGVFLALVSTVFWSLFWILNVRDRRDEVAKLFLSFAFGAAFSLAAVLAFSDLRVGAGGLLGGAYVGVFEMGVTFVVWLKALKTSRTTAQVSNLIYISPFLSLIPIHFVGGEEIFISSVVGLVFIVGGVLLQEFDARRRKGCQAA